MNIKKNMKEMCTSSKPLYTGVPRLCETVVQLSGVPFREFL